MLWLIILIMFVLISPVFARDRLVEPGTLLSVQIKDGKTVEKYSDGLLVVIEKNGDRSEERDQDGHSMQAKMPDDYDEGSSGISRGR
jgi:hypothetical protein